MITSILADHRHFHSEWQIDHAITIRAGGTLYGCYKQAVRELHKRWRGLRDCYRQRELLAVDIDEMEQPRNSTGHHADCRRRIELCEKRLGLIEADGVIRDTEREFLRFLGQAIACRHALGISADGSLDDSLREKLDAEMWEHNIKAMAAVDFMSQGRIGRSTIELLAACAPAMRMRIARLVLDEKRHQELIDWYLMSELPMPPPVELSAAQQREALGCVLRISAGPPESGEATLRLSSHGENSAIA